MTPLVEEPIATGGWPFLAMTSKQQIRRAKLLLLILVAAFGVLASRLIQLQVLQHAELSARAAQNTERRYWQAPRRGDILDVNGNILATSITVKTVCADPSLLANQIGSYQAVVAHAVAPLLNLNEADLLEKLTPRIARNAKGDVVTNGLHYVRLAKNISEDNWARMVAVMTNLTFGVDETKLKGTNRAFYKNLREHAIFAETEPKRVYPNSNLAAQVIGFMGVSNGVRNVCMDPSLLGNYRSYLARVIAPVLSLDEASLNRALLPQIGRNARDEIVTNTPHYVRLINGVNDDTWKRLALVMTNLSFGVDETRLPAGQQAFYRNLREHAVFTGTDQKRFYLNDAPDATGGKDAFIASQVTGRDGVEFAMQKELNGVAGWKVTETDRQARELVAYRDEYVHPRDGLNVVLTIDTAVQHIVETALVDALAKHSPKSITGIVMRPRTGEILALASLPSYDPNNLSTISTNNRNRVIADVVEPGSTFKIVVVSGALNDKKVKLTDPFFCENGHFAFAGRILHDHEALGYQTVEQVITHSSNIGAAKIGIKLGGQELYNYARSYGFGQYTGLPLPGEARGILYPTNLWSKVSIAQIPMGHGVAVTRLQMLMAMAAIANDGWLMRPMIISRLQDRDGRVVQRYAPERIRQVIGEAARRDMIHALKTVPTKDGTAPDAAMKNYVVAGKTGTAQKAEHGVYVSGKFISSFIGFFPADNPQICISVVMDEPKEGYYGGKVCGPVFRDIAERCASYLNIPPDPALMTNAPAIVAENHNHKFQTP